MNFRVGVHERGGHPYFDDQIPESVGLNVRKLVILTWNQANPHAAFVYDSRGCTLGAWAPKRHVEGGFEHAVEAFAPPLEHGVALEGLRVTVSAVTLCFAVVSHTVDGGDECDLTFRADCEMLADFGAVHVELAHCLEPGHFLVGHYFSNAGAFARLMHHDKLDVSFAFGVGAKVFRFFFAAVCYLHVPNLPWVLGVVNACLKDLLGLPFLVAEAY